MKELVATNIEYKTTEKEAREAVLNILEYIGEDTTREGLLETPKRHIKFLEEFTTARPFSFTTFENDGSDEMVIVKNIDFYSLCEHHLLPFFGVGHIAYLPGKRIAGISKLPRVLELYANKPQNQERITRQVAEFLMQQLEANGVAVVLEARHTCMEMRGIKKPGAETVTSCMLGRFKDSFNTRQEFLNLIKK